MKSFSRYVYVIFLSLFICSFALADEAQFNCWGDAGTRYKVDPWLLHAVAIVESRLNPWAINRNSNGTEDLGIAQINSLWLPTIERFGGSRERLIKDVCYNINVEAWILATLFAKYGVSWRTVGYYHTGPNPKPEAEARLAEYIRKVGTVFNESLKQRGMQ